LGEIIKELPTVIAECGEYKQTGDDYNNGDNKNLYKYLLLAIVAYCWKRWPMRYDFNRHRNIINWSLEHIFARNQKNLNNEELKEWLPSISDDEWNDYKDNCIEGNGNEWLAKREELKKIYPSEDVDDSLSNMALLPKNANSSLNNKLFEGKRNLIIQWAEDSWNKYWTPPLTEAVFLKALPGLSVNSLFWSKNDKKEYVGYIQKVTAEFIDSVKNLLNN
jgi:hypothetical protein